MPEPKKITAKKVIMMSEVLRALGHPIRIAIIELLESNDELTVSDIFTKLGIEQAIASQHLAIMKNKGILSCRRDGKNVWYSLKLKQLEHIVECMNKFE